jgi:hypothetical protein
MRRRKAKVSVERLVVTDTGREDFDRSRGCRWRQHCIGWEANCRCRCEKPTQRMASPPQLYYGARIRYVRRSARPLTVWGKMLLTSFWCCCWLTDHFAMAWEVDLNLVRLSFIDKGNCRRGGTTRTIVIRQHEVGLWATKQSFRCSICSCLMVPAWKTYQYLRKRLGNKRSRHPNHTVIDK